MTFAVNEVWEDSSLEPFLITICRTDEENVDFQLSIEANETDNLGKAGRRLRGEKVTGEDWESMFREFLEKVSSPLNERLLGDSGDEIFVVWTQDEASFRDLLNSFWNFVKRGKTRLPWSHRH